MAASMALKGLLRSQVRNAKLSSSVFLMPSRTIAGKVKRMEWPEEYKNDKPAFDYRNKLYNKWYSVFDKTTHRFNENTKMVVVEGAQAVGKTQFAKDLAEELGMLYVPEATMDEIYVNYYGEDMRDLDPYFRYPINQSYDEKDFIRDPVEGPHPCAPDRLLVTLYELKFRNYFFCLRHIFNTGQGVVTEGSPYSHQVLANAVYKGGWLDKETKLHLEDLAKHYSLPYLMKPNLVIYLDAPADVVRRNIKALGNPWDVDSPVWKSDAFLNAYTDGMKNNYLQEARKDSQVLAYDWSEGGELDIVVEDIEELNFDYYGIYERQQSDWRIHDEVEATARRTLYSRPDELYQMYRNMLHAQKHTHKYLSKTSIEIEDFDEVMRHVRGNRYTPGFNPPMGDSVLFKTSDHRANFEAMDYSTNPGSKAPDQHTVFFDLPIREDIRFGSENIGKETPRPDFETASKLSKWIF